MGKAERRSVKNDLVDIQNIETFVVLYLQNTDNNYKVFVNVRWYSHIRGVS